MQRPLKGGGSVSLCFVGDILLDRGVRQHVENTAKQRGYQDEAKAVHQLFDTSIDQLFHSSQVVVANLECPATDIHSPVMKRFIFRGEPSWLPVLKHHGITHCNLANNHSVDQGRKGLLSTIENVRRAGMIPFGAGNNMDEASCPVLLVRQPRPVYLLASLQMPLENFPFLPQRPCVSQMNIETLCQRIRQLKKKEPNCVVFVSLHWGWEHTLKPLPQQRMQAHQLIDSGADALVCHHTHTRQTAEIYRGKPIFYSIGNFIFDQTKPINTRALAVQFCVTANSVTHHTYPILIHHCVPRISKNPFPVGQSVRSQSDR